MTSHEFGIYILTYPGDYHLSTILVRSIQQVSPDLPIMIIPGEGFDLKDHPFDVPVMPIPGGFWAEIGHQDRDFWAFQGPFETFLYLDADTLVVKSLDDLANRIVRQQGDFIYVQPWMDDEQWLSIIRDPVHPEHNKYVQEVRREVGPASLDRFDPDHDCFSHRNFNSGAFARTPDTGICRSAPATPSGDIIMNAHRAQCLSVNGCVGPCGIPGG